MSQQLTWEWVSSTTEVNILRTRIQDILKELPQLVFLGFGTRMNYDSVSPKFNGKLIHVNHLLSPDFKMSKPSISLLRGDDMFSIYFANKVEDVGERIFIIPQYLQDIKNTEPTMQTRTLIL